MMSMANFMTPIRGMIDLDWLATTCECMHIRVDWLYIDGYCTQDEVKRIHRIIYDRTHAPAVQGPRGQERKPQTREVQLSLDFSLNH